MALFNLTIPPALTDAVKAIAAAEVRQAVALEALVTKAYEDESVLQQQVDELVRKLEESNTKLAAKTAEATPGSPR